MALSDYFFNEKITIIIITRIKNLRNNTLIRKIIHYTDFWAW